MKEKGLVLVITGKGKGKSSSAFGMIIRSLGWGRKVLLVQFLKGLMETGEERFFRELSNTNLKIIRAKCPFTWKSSDKAKDAEVCHEVWKEALNLIRENNYDFVVFDELMIAVEQGFLKLSEVISFLHNRKATLDVVLTGRNAPSELVEVADTVSDIQSVKHIFDKGFSAKKGVDY